MSETVEVDVSNPGQVLACLGLLEVAELLAPGSLGAFAKEETFEIESRAGLSAITESLENATLREERSEGESPPWEDDKSYPVVAEGIFGSLVIDPWLEPDHSRTAVGLKLWAGRLCTLNLLKGLQAGMQPGAGLPARQMFDWEARGTPTGLDHRSAVSKEDLGFSYDSQHLKPVIYPVVELFAMVGLEGARPRKVGPTSYAYSLWDEPLPPAIGRTVLAGALPSLASSRWVYRVESRGLGGTYRYLSQARPNEVST
jgi:CRISPR-associated protein Csx14